MTAVWAEAIRMGDSPETVAATVTMAASARTPMLRYPAGKTAGRLALLRQFVPAGAFDKSLRKQMGLTG